jgi:hypothetical protein
LVETSVYADWDYYGSGYEFDTGGSCWANPDTGLSSWQVESCYKYFDADLNAAWSIVNNLSSNEDFGGPGLTYVDQEATVYQEGGDAAWEADWSDWGELSWLIYGWVLSSEASCE